MWNRRLASLKIWVILSVDAVIYLEIVYKLDEEWKVNDINVYKWYFTLERWTLYPADSQIYVRRNYTIEYSKINMEFLLACLFNHDSSVARLLFTKIYGITWEILRIQKSFYSLLLLYKPKYDGMVIRQFHS